MMESKKKILNQLTFVRLFGFVFKLLILLGRAEVYIIKRVFNLQIFSVLKPQRSLLSLPINLLVKLGYLVSIVFNWLIQKIVSFFQFIGFLFIKLFTGIITIGKTVDYILVVWPAKKIIFFQQLIQYSLADRKASKEQKKYQRSRKRKKIKQEIIVPTDYFVSPKPYFSFFRSAFGFAMLIILLILPIKFYDNYQFLNNLKAKIINISEAALSDISNAKQDIGDKNFALAQQHFSQASSNFLNAENQLNIINSSLFTLAKLVPNKSIQLVGNSKHIVKAGQLASKVAAKITASINLLLTDHKDKKLTEVISNFSALSYQALQEVKQLNQEIKQIDFSAIPTEYRDEFIALQKQSIFLQTSLQDLLSIASGLQIFLGDSYDKRYLLIFQNNTEMRGSGGFMGSYATIDFSQGEIKNLEAPQGGTYDTEAGLRVLIRAPEPLWTLNPLWHFWDSNWWPDWPTSAKKIMWFYEKSSGPSVDGVISFTPTVLKKVLSAIGPIDLTEDFGVVIDKDNFLITLQEQAEQKPYDTKQPKKIIGVLLEKIIDKISSNLHRDELIKIINALDESLQEKQILLYFTDQHLEQQVKKFNWAGEIKDADFDYLMVANTNLRGGKTDKVIQQKMYLNSTIRPDGTIVNELTIERHHQGHPGTKFYGVKNIDWMRIYVPAGSQLISATGFKPLAAWFYEQPDKSWKIDPDLKNERNAKREPTSRTRIYKENNKTVFANWSIVQPGETTIIRLVYKLPFKLEKKVLPQTTLDKFKNLLRTEPTYSYDFLAQKQPGATNVQLYYHLDVQADFKLDWHYPKTAEAEFNTDKYWAYLFSNNKQ